MALPAADEDPERALLAAAVAEAEAEPPDAAQPQESVRSWLEARLRRIRARLGRDAAG